MEIPEHFMYFSYDGDGIGRKVGRSILANDIDELRHISHLIEAGHALIQRWVKDRAGIWINGGGDEGNAAVAPEYVEELEQVRKDYEYLVGATISIGVGKSPSEAGRALLIAKLKGKNQIVEFSEATEREIEAIKRRAKKGAMKSMEEYKLAEAYLNKSESEELCPYCQQTDGIDLNHCKFCHDAEAVEGAETCPFCAEGSSDLGENNCEFCKEGDQNAQESCPYCKEGQHSDLSPQPTAAEEDMANRSKQAEQTEAMEMNSPAIDKPDPVGEAPVPAPPMAAQASPMDGIDPEDNSSKDALSAIATQIESEGNPTQMQVNAVDDADVSSGDEMEGNVSRPEGYGQNTPGDMGTGGANGPEENGDEPDLSSILEEGLDHNADGIQREKAIQMVSQALAQFKGCKDILEAARAQTPQLYQASITMLKAMIEMASMMGLGQSGPALGQNSAELGQNQAALTPQQEENEWHNPFPAHPDQGGEAKPGHAPSSAEGGAVGQPIGKLSAKHTTEHVARTPMPPGAVNAKGQQKVVDDQGKTRFIDRKNGMVQGPSGAPIKPPKRGNDVPKN